MLEAVRTRLGEIYEHDLRSTQQFLKLATEGNRNPVDEMGRLRLPPLKQRRTSPRMPLSQDCTMILAGGPVSRAAGGRFHPGHGDRLRRPGGRWRACAPWN